MREPGFEELADLWQDPIDGEREAFEALARRARRRGRLLGYIDIALAAVIVGATLLGAFATPHPAIIGIALLLIVATLWLTWKRRSLRQMAAALNTANPAAFVESSVRSATSNLRRVTLGLVLIPPLFATAVLFRVTRRTGGEFDHLLEGIVAWASAPRGMIALTIAVLLMARLAYSRRQLRIELRRLEKLRLDYEEESRRDRAS